MVCGMRNALVAAIVFAFASTWPSPAGAQPAAEPGDPLRIAIVVDNSHTLLDHTPQMRRGLQQFVNALPPNHELMLVTTGGQMNIRVHPTRDYLEILEAISEINRQREGGNAMIGAVQEIYDRFMRTVERRYPMFVILTGDGNDTSSGITNRSVNAMLNGLTKTGVIVNAVMLSSSGVGLVRNFVLEMIERTGGSQESVLSATALPARLKIIAGRVAGQYKKLSPDKVPTAEFRRSDRPK